MAEVQTVIQSLLELATCPVCFERLTSSAICCINGHALCAQCKTNLTKCPTCAGRFSNQKQTTLHQILDTLPFLCKFSGCSEVTRDIGDHQKWCGFRPTQCRRCNWTGAVNDLSEHAEKKHMLIYTDEEREHHLDHDFVWINPRVQYDQMFWEVKKYNAQRKCFIIQMIWVPDGQIKDEVFEIKVAFKSHDTSYEASTKIKFDPDVDKEEKNCLIFHTDIMKPFMQKNNITYDLYLIQN